MRLTRTSWSRLVSGREKTLTSLLLLYIAVIGLRFTYLVGYFQIDAGDSVHWFLRRVLGLYQEHGIFNVWTSYPPVFPSIIWAFFLLVGKDLRSFNIFLHIFLLVCDLGIVTLIYFITRIVDEQKALLVSFMWTCSFAAVMYFSVYWDSFPTFLTLLALYLLIRGETAKSAIIAGVGIMTKLWTGIVCINALKKRKILYLVIAAFLSLALASPFLLVNAPIFLSSFIWQGGLNGAETIWAIFAGWWGCGFNPSPSEMITPVISTSSNPIYSILLVGLAISFVFVLLFCEVKSAHDHIMFATLNLFLFLFWNKLWSDQWIVWILPLIYLSYPSLRGFTLGFAFQVVNYLDYPVIRSDWGLNFGIWSETNYLVLVSVRTLLILLVIVDLAKRLVKKQKVKLQEESAEEPSHISRQEITVVIPTLNEVENLRILIPDLIASAEKYSLSQIIFVDDGSKDGTQELIQEYQRKYNRLIMMVERGRRLGLGTAVSDGIKLARTDYVLVMDADLNHPVSAIPLLEKYIPEYDVVIGSRHIPGAIYHPGDSVRKYIDKLGNWWVRNLLGLPVNDVTSGLRLIKQSFFLGAKVTNAGGEYIIVSMNRMYRMGARIKEVPVEFRPRSIGRSRQGQLHKTMWNYVKATLREWVNNLFSKKSYQDKIV